MKLFLASHLYWSGEPGNYVDIYSWLESHKSDNAHQWFLIKLDRGNKGERAY